MDKEVKKLIDFLYEKGEEIEFTPSREAERLFKYNIVPSKMGGFGDQAFTTMVFAEGDMRQLNAYMLFSQVRLVDNDLFTVEHLKAMFLDTVPLSAEFLYTCGFDNLWDYTQKVIRVLDLVDNKEDYKELITAYCFYVTCLHNWVHLLFPWYIGELFPRKEEEEVKKMATYF